MANGYPPTLGGEYRGARGNFPGYFGRAPGYPPTRRGTRVPGTYLTSFDPLNCGEEEVGKAGVS